MLSRVARILALVMAAFTALFALDVFDGSPLLQTVIALVMHLLSTLIIVLCTAIAWRSPRIGGLLFIMLAVGFSLWFQMLATLVAICLPLAIIGILFLLSAKR